MAAPFIPKMQMDCVVDLYHGNEIHGDLEAAFQQAMDSGVAMIIHKATQGTEEVDDQFAVRRAVAAKIGLLFSAYHWANAEDPAAQAQHFISTVGDLTNIGFAVDAEKDDESQVTIENLIAIVREIGRLIGRKLDWLYMGASGPDGAGTGMTPDAMAELASLVTDLWLPEYGSKPICPLGFSTWKMHQYTGDGINGSGYVAGIGTGLDRSFYAGSIMDLKAYFAQLVGGIAPPPPVVIPPPPPKPATPVITFGTAIQLQSALQMSGDYKGSLDGIFGPNSHKALDAFLARAN